MATAQAPTTTFTWRIANLERETQDGFVYTAHWVIDANDGTYSSGAYGSVGFERHDDLVPFSELSEEMVVGWVKEHFGAEKVAEIETSLQQQLDQQRNPTKAAGVPWAAQA
jgi:hypothetical protein